MRDYEKGRRMNEKDIIQQYHTIEKLLLHSRLKEALKILENQINHAKAIELKNEHIQISTSYQYMLKYMAEGVADPERKKLYDKLIKDTLNLNDRTKVLLLDTVSFKFYYTSRIQQKTKLSLTYEEILNTLESFKDDFAVASLMGLEQLEPILEKREDANKELFYKVWLNIRLSSEEVEVLENILASSLVNPIDENLLISALTMSLMECFDEEKLKILLNGYTHPNIEVNQRALVGMALIFQLYSERLSLYPEIVHRIEFLNESESFGDNLSRVYTQLLRSQDTEEIERKMKEEIFPEMMKKASSLKGFDFENLEIDEDEMKDWEDKLEDSDFEEKIKEMQELQMQGEDIYMTTFTHLKSYPFFQEFHHWFYPFDKQHSSVIKELGFSSEKSNPIIDLILGSNIFCNSDKYSLCFMVQHIPQAQKDMMLSELSEAQQAQLEEEKKEISSNKTNPKFTTNQYVHDLYRFFKLYRRKSDFEDIFSKKMNLHQVPILKQVLYTPKHLSFLADFFLFKERYIEAIEIFQVLMNEMEESSFLLFQKFGFACQREKRYVEAIDAYLKADLISPNSLWIYRNLALCYRRVQAYDKALVYYKKIEEIQPKNKNNLYYIGFCLSNLESYDEALNYFFQLDLMDSNNPRTWRSIGWCSFITDKQEQAERYYAKVLEKKPHRIDFINAGHIAWVTGNLELAKERYKEGLKASGTVSEFIEKINSDKKLLIQFGISEDDIPLMIDLAL